MAFDSQFHKMLTFPLCGIVLDHFRPRPPRKRERCGQVESDPNKKIFTPLNSTCNFEHNLPIKFDIVCIKPTYLLGHYLTGAIDPWPRPGMSRCSDRK